MAVVFYCKKRREEASSFSFQAQHTFIDNSPNATLDNNTASTLYEHEQAASTLFGDVNSNEDKFSSAIYQELPLAPKQPNNIYTPAPLHTPQASQYVGLNELDAQ